MSLKLVSIILTDIYFAIKWQLSHMIISHVFHKNFDIHFTGELQLLHMIIWQGFHRAIEIHFTGKSQLFHMVISQAHHRIFQMQFTGHDSNITCLFYIFYMISLHLFYRETGSLSHFRTCIYYMKGTIKELIMGITLFLDELWYICLLKMKMNNSF